MTICDSKADVVARLDRLVATPRGARPKVRAKIESLRARLVGPVRVGLFGPARSNKRALLNGLVGQRLAPLQDAAPTLEAVPGAERRARALFPDGTWHDAPGDPAGLFARGPVFLSVSLPELGAVNRSYLLVMSDDTPEDMAAGARWAAERVDLAVWCASDWSPRMNAIWHAFPETLRDHAVLCWSGLTDPTHEAVPVQQFRAVLAWHPGSDEVPFAPDPAVSGDLQAVIDEATRQDILAAEVLLARYRDAGSEKTGRTDARDSRHPDPMATPPAVGPMDGPAAAAAAATGRTVEAPSDAIVHATPTSLPVLDDDADAEARSELAQLFRFVRDRAASLRGTLSTEGQDTDDTLEAFEDIFSGLEERAEGFCAASRVWPEIRTAICDARDVALLLRMEGGADQAQDAARLLLQLRWEFEAKLAA